MVDQTKREIQDHGSRDFPAAAYDWYGPNVSGKVLEKHWHEGWEFLCIYEGTALFYVGREKLLLKKSDVLLIPGNSIHMAEEYNRQTCRYRSIVFSVSMLKGLLDDLVQTKYIEPFCLNLSRRSIVFSGEDAVPEGWYGEKINALFEKAFFVLNKKTGAYEILSKAYLYELIAYTALYTGLSPNQHNGQGSTPKLGGIKEAMLFMTENMQSQITLPQLAKTARISTGHFGKLFRQATSYSPIEYLMNLRLTRAANLLVSSDDQILNIALDVGFNNLGHFIRSFEKKFGCSPRQYRKEKRFAEEKGIETLDLSARAEKDVQKDLQTT